MRAASHLGTFLSTLASEEFSLSCSLVSSLSWSNWISSKTTCGSAPMRCLSWPQVHRG